MSFTPEEEARLRALANETNRTLPKLLHFVALYGAILYRDLIDEHGSVSWADRTVIEGNRRFRERPLWPTKVEGPPAPCLDDHPELVE